MDKNRPSNTDQKALKDAIQTQTQKASKSRTKNKVKLPTVSANTTGTAKATKLKIKKPQFKVPEAERERYKLLVQQANRTIKSNLKYIEKMNIKDKDTIRSLVHNYNKKKNWAKNKKGQRMKSPLSRSIMFKNEREYRDYLHHLEKMGKVNAKNLTKGYKSTIKDRLQRISNIYGVQLPNNKIPDDLLKEIDNLTLPQLKNWFHIGDPEEDMEVSEYGSDDFMGVDDYQDFKDITLKRLGWLKKAY